MDRFAVGIPARKLHIRLPPGPSPAASRHGHDVELFASHLSEEPLKSNTVSQHDRRSIPYRTECPPRPRSCQLPRPKRLGGNESPSATAARRSTFVGTLASARRAVVLPALRRRSRRTCGPTLVRTNCDHLRPLQRDSVSSQLPFYGGQSTARAFTAAILASKCPVLARNEPWT